MRSGLTALLRLFRQISALFLECDVNDLNVISDPACADMRKSNNLSLRDIREGSAFHKISFYNFIKIVSARKDIN
jgi:hypothetical protein